MQLSCTFQFCLINFFLLVTPSFPKQTSTNSVNINNKIFRNKNQRKKAATIDAMSSSSTESSTTSVNKREHVMSSSVGATTTTTAAMFSFRKFLNASNFMGTSSVGTTTTTTTSKTTQEQPKQKEQQQDKPNDLHLHRDPVYMWSSLVAGAGSAAMASVSCAPLDLIRTRLQVWGDVVPVAKVSASSRGNAAATAVVSQRGHVANIPLLLREIIRKEGWAGCFRGLGATLVTVPAFWGVYFPLYDDLKRHWTIHYPQTSQSWIHMGSAVVAGAVSDLLCNPMFVVRTRLQTDALHAMMGEGGGTGRGGMIRPKSVTETIKSLYLEGGLLIFWRGMMANIVGLSHVAIQFPVYESLKYRMRIHNNDAEKNGPTELLVASALSKMMACLVSYPHEVIRSRMQDARMRHVGFLETCQRIYMKEGLFGFYSGLPITLLRVLPNTCITFISYELLLQWARSQIEADRRSNSSSSSSSST